MWLFLFALCVYVLIIVIKFDDVRYKIALNYRTLKKRKNFIILLIFNDIFLENLAQKNCSLC